MFLTIPDPLEAAILGGFARERTPIRLDLMMSGMSAGLGRYARPALHRLTYSTQTWRLSQSAV